MRLRFWWATGTEPVDVDDELVDIDAAFAATAASFTGEEGGELALPAMQDCDVGGCDESVDPTPDQQSLFNAVTPEDETIDVFVAEHLSDDDEGCAKHPENALAVVVTRNHSRWALAHELGHLAGLGHVLDTSSLMHKRPREIVGTPVLTPAEVARVNEFVSS